MSNYKQYILHFCNILKILINGLLITQNGSAGNGFPHHAKIIALKQDIRLRFQYGGGHIPTCWLLSFCSSELKSAKVTLMPIWHFGQSQIKDHQQCHLLYCQKQSSKLKRFIAILDTYSVGGLQQVNILAWISTELCCCIWSSVFQLSLFAPIIQPLKTHSKDVQIKAVAWRVIKLIVWTVGVLGDGGWLRNGWIIINGNRIWFLWLTIHRASQNYGYTLNNLFNVENVVKMFFQEIIVNILATATTHFP